MPNKTELVQIEADRIQSLDYLRSILPEGSRVTGIRRYRNRNGDTHHVSILAAIDGDVQNISFDVARAIGRNRASERYPYHAVVFGGGGTNPVHGLIHDLGKELGYKLGWSEIS